MSAELITPDAIAEAYRQVGTHVRRTLATRGR